MAYISYSSWTTLRSCPEKFRLQKLRAPAVPSYAAVGGSAFHAATEKYDLYGGDITELWRAAFSEALDEARKVEPDESLWYRAGKVTEATPNKEDLAFWSAHGEEWAVQYVEFVRTLEWKLWELPDGSPAVEVGVLANLGDVPTKQFVDRIYVTGDGELIIVDLKTGSRKPQDHSQLGVYACGVEQTLGVRPTFGCYYMARRVEHTIPVSLNDYTVELLGAQFDIARRLWEAGIFLPNPDQHCRWCGVRNFCRVGGGPDWRDYAELIPTWSGDVIYTGVKLGE